MNAVLCKDCRHSSANWFVRLTRNTYLFKCTLPENYRQPKWDPVIGVTEPGYFYGCHSARSDRTVCGPEAKRWEPTDKKHFFTYLKRI